MEKRRREKAAKALLKKQTELAGEMCLEEERHVSKALERVDTTGEDDPQAYEQFRKEVTQRHAEEMSALQVASAVIE